MTRWLLIVFAFFTGGCASLTPRVEQSGTANKAETDTAGVMVKAELDKIAERFVLLNKDIQKSVNGQLSATRDAVQTSTQTVGMSSWAVVAAIFVMIVGAAYEDRCDARVAMAAKPPVGRWVLENGKKVFVPMEI